MQCPRARAPHLPNQALRRLLAEAGWSGARFAREINAAGAEHHRTLTYDRTAVAHWLAGTRPRAFVAELAAEVLSRALGRPVGVPDTGLTDAHADPGGRGSPAWGGAAVDMLEGLDDPFGRRDLTLSGVYSLAALAVPTWAPPSARPDPAARADLARVGPAQIDVCRALLPVFSRHDAAFGAGGVRHAMRHFLATSVAGWLRQPAEPRFRRELCTIAGQLAYLCGFAHFDSNLQPQAQQYYLTSLALAREAGDRAGYALGLRGLSVQAHALGHLAQADRLAAQAVGVGMAHTPASQQAFLLGQLAVTRAGLGDPKAAAQHLAAAERRLAQPAVSALPVGTYHPASLSLQHAAVATGLRDHRGAARALQTSLRHRPVGEARSRAISLADLAEAQLGLGGLDIACQTWSDFLTLYPQISSARVDDRLDSLLARLRPHRRNRAASTLLDRAAHLRPPRSG